MSVHVRESVRECVHESVRVYMRVKLLEVKLAVCTCMRVCIYLYL